MVNRRPSPANNLPEGVVKGERGMGDLLFGDEKVSLIWGHSYISYFKKKSYLAKVILLISGYS